MEGFTTSCRKLTLHSHGGSFMLVLCFLGLHFHEHVQCSLVIKPQNVAVLSGEVATISCASDSEDSVAWVAYSPGSTERDYIFGGRDLTPSAAQYISISRAGKGHYSLHINATRKAAKRYFCVEQGSTEEASCELVVIEINPECLTKVTTDFIIMTCVVKFAGNWAPTMEWRTQNGTNIATDLFYSRNNFVTIYLFLPMNLTMNSTVYKIDAVTKFGQSGRPKETSATNVPEFNHTTSPYSSGFECINVTQTVEIHAQPYVPIYLICLIVILFAVCILTIMCLCKRNMTYSQQTEMKSL